MGSAESYQMTFRFTPEGLLQGVNGSIPIKDVQQVRSRRRGDAVRVLGIGADALLFILGFGVAGIGVAVGPMRGELFPGILGLGVMAVAFWIGGAIRKSSSLCIVEVVPASGPPLAVSGPMPEQAARANASLMGRILASDMKPETIERIGRESVELTKSGAFL